MQALMPRERKQACTHCGFVARPEDLQCESKWSEECQRWRTTYRCWRCVRRMVSHAQRNGRASARN